MKSADVFPSKYLRAADLNGREPVVTISHVTMETVGDDNKPVLYFEGKEQGIVLNKTNWAALEDITGKDDTDDWKGHRVKLVMRKVEYQGKRVPAIRIEEAPSAPPARRHRDPEPEPEPVFVGPTTVPIDNDDIPF